MSGCDDYSKFKCTFHVLNDRYEIIERHFENDPHIFCEHVESVHMDMIDEKVNHTESYHVYRIFTNNYEALQNAKRFIKLVK